MPLSNPYGSTQNYVDWKFSQPLFIEGGDPFDYSSGREIDGLPVSEAEFQRRVGKDVGVGVYVGGKLAAFVNLTDRSAFSHVNVAFDLYRSGQRTSRPDFWYYLGRFNKDFALSGNRLFQRKQGPAVGKIGARLAAELQETTTVPLGDLRSNLEKILKQGRCEEYTNNLLDRAATMFAGHYPHFNTVMEGYSLIAGPKGGGYILKQVPFDTVDVIYLRMAPAQALFG